MSDPFRGYSLESLRNMDDLAYHLSQTDFSAAEQGNFRAVHNGRTSTPDRNFGRDTILVYPVGGGNIPVPYDVDTLIKAGSYTDVVEARPGPKGRES